MTQGVSVYAALKRAADTSFDDRSRGQVMADTLVERVTGHPADVPVPVAVNLVMTDETLLGGATTPARVPGYGPVPAAIACRLAGDAIADEQSKATLRRLYRHPDSGALVAMESRSRLFPKGLAQFIAFRDDTCRTPYCDAPIRHARPRHPTCARWPHHCRQRSRHVRGLQLRQGSARLACPYVQMPTVERHKAVYVTPTGARHESHAPPLPNDVVMFKPSAVEALVANRLAD